MKVIDGKFKKEQKKDMPLAEKIMLALAQQIDEDTEGTFVLLMDVGGSEIFVSTDTGVADAVFLLEAAKLNLLINPLDEEILH